MLLIVKHPSTTLMGMLQIAIKTLEMNIIHPNTFLSGELKNNSIFLINFQVKKLVIISYRNVCET